MRNIIAILRGVTPDEIETIVDMLLAAGISKIEVPLNSPDPFASIERMIKRFAGQAMLGAGTVLDVAAVERLREIGADMVVSPNCDVNVIEATKAAGMQSFPGVMTPSEAFLALQAGADGLKFFPGELVTPVGMKAMRAVLPPEAVCLAVGGAKPENFREWVKAGASGFGIGSAIYQAGDTPEAVAQKASAIVAAYDEAFS